MPANSTQPVLAVFDFDGTLTDRHTFWRYMRFIVGTQSFWLRIVPLLPKMLSVILGITPLMQARLAFIACYLGGLSVEQEREHAKYFISEQLPLWLRPEALRRLQWHQLVHVLAKISLIKVVQLVIAVVLQVRPNLLLQHGKAVLPKV